MKKEVLVKATGEVVEKYKSSKDKQFEYLLELIGFKDIVEIGLGGRYNAFLNNKEVLIHSNKHFYTYLKEKEKINIFKTLESNTSTETLLSFLNTFNINIYTKDEIITRKALDIYMDVNEYYRKYLSSSLLEIFDKYFKFDYDFILSFGKYKNKNLSYIFNINPNYLEWLIDNTNQIEIKNKIIKFIESEKGQNKVNI